MYQDECNQKAQAAKAYYAQAATKQSIGGSCGYEPRPTPTQEAERRAQRSFDDGAKAEAAALFLRQHPEFDEFIQLIRKGAIGI